MSLGLLVLPALVGFLFLFVGRRTRFRLMQLSGYQVVFQSALVGVVFLILARGFVLILDERLVALEPSWRAFAPFEYSGTIGFSAVLALFVAGCRNLFTDPEVAARQSARQSGNQILWLLRDSLARNRMVEVTLRSSKSYVGYAQDTGVKTQRADPDVTLIPMASGFRHSETRELVLTTFYGKTAAEFLVSYGRESSWTEEDFQVAVPFSEIVSARLFDPVAFQMFHTPPNDESSSASGDVMPDPDSAPGSELSPSGRSGPDRVPP